ncbi:MAG: CapA family protein [Rickettsiales bacterium]|jgi:poly-gamma-glutamate synthesis protein (capsule biosynthesis protein)|nr:CapA family protein [Rickettsiales bacterium]
MILLKRLLFRAKNIFLGKPKRANNADISILLCGDFMLDSRIEPYLLKYGMMYPFRGLMAAMSEYDVRAVNLETPVSNLAGIKWPDKKFNFKGAPYIARMLSRAGFGYASLANNHILDFGTAVAKDTVNNLNRWEIKSSGVPFAPNPGIVKSNGYKIAFLSFMDAEIAPEGFEKSVCIYDKRAAEIARAKRAADFVIVSMHWGEELAPHASGRQKKIAREIIDAGASVVWGHHPHVIQEMEKYKNGFIFYSLGNFIFSHLSPSITRGMIAGLEVKDNKVKSVRKYIINNDNYLVNYAPRIVRIVS